MLTKKSTDTPDFLFHLENGSVHSNGCASFRKAGDAAEPPHLDLKVQAISCVGRGSPTGKLRFVTAADTFIAVSEPRSFLDVGLEAPFAV